MAKAWTPEEDEQLLRLRSEGFTAREIAVRLTRSEGAVRVRGASLATEKQRKWTDEERELVFQMKSEGHTNKFIAKRLGRSPGAIATFVSKNWHAEDGGTEPGKNSS